MLTRKCTKCGKEKPLSDFYDDKKGGGKRQPCKACMREIRFNKAHPEMAEIGKDFDPVHEIPALPELPGIPEIVESDKISIPNKSETGKNVNDKIVNSTVRIQKSILKRLKKRAIDEDKTLNQLFINAAIEYLKRK